MITVDELRSILDYWPDTGVFRWKVSVHGSRGKGGVAGRVRGTYRGITYHRKEYAEHRLAWLHFYGRWPTDILDHINRDGLDNRITNLREATLSLNQANRGVSKSSTSGFKGVSLRSDGKAWCASIRKEGKTFRLGHFASPEEAAAAYVAASVALNGEFASF